MGNRATTLQARGRIPLADGIIFSGGRREISPKALLLSLGLWQAVLPPTADWSSAHFTDPNLNRVRRQQWNDVATASAIHSKIRDIHSDDFAVPPLLAHGDQASVGQVHGLIRVFAN